MRHAILLGFLGFIVNCYGQPYTRLWLNSPPNRVGSGARAAGQGNAFIAVADDATAADWNPAGLSQLWKPELSLALEAYSRDIDWSVTGHPEATGGDDLGLRDLNYASAVLPLPFERNMVLSLSYLKLFRFDADMNYSLLTPGFITTDEVTSLKQRGSFSVVALGFATDVTDKLALGASVYVWNDGVTGDSVYDTERVQDSTLSLFAPGDMGIWHTVEKHRYEIDEGYSIVLGLMYRFSKELTLGAVVKPPFELHMDRKSNYTSVQLNGPGEDRFGDSADGDLVMPLVIGSGLAWRPNDVLTVALDMTWTQWSEYYMSEDGEDTNPLTGKSVADDECDDTFTFSLGMEYLLIFPERVIPLRCGVAYDPAPAVDGVDDFYTLSMGIGYHVGPAIFDMAYQLRWGRSVNESTQVAPGWSEDLMRHRFLASPIVHF